MNLRLQNIDRSCLLYRLPYHMMYLSLTNVLIVYNYQFYLLDGVSTNGKACSYLHSRTQQKAWPLTKCRRSSLNHVKTSEP